uniref:hypothetical protein n=1 Tax=Cellulomonas iranensis TaxID=76862 RepID=UPI0011789004
MTLESSGSTTGHRRTARIALAAGLVAALCAAALVTAFAAPADDPRTAPPAAKSAAEKLGSADAQLLTDAESKGTKSVTLMVDTALDATEQFVRQLDAVH